MTGYHIAGIILIAVSALFVAAAGVFEKRGAKKKAAAPNAQAAPEPEPDFGGYVPPRPALFIEADGERYHLPLEKGETAAAFVSGMSRGELTAVLDGTDGRLALGPKSDLPGAAAAIEALPGDIVITEEGYVAVCLTAETLNAIRVARCGMDGEKLAAALSGKTTDARFFVEWSE